MNDADITAMNPGEVKDYILNFISTLKLTEKQINNLDDEILKWQSRLELATSKDMNDLAQEAQKEISRLTEKKAALCSETKQLKQKIEEMRLQLPVLASRQRSIDTDLLEQELLMAAGYMPGDEEKARTEREFRELEKTQKADTALDELKTKMQKEN